MRRPHTPASGILTFQLQSYKTEIQGPLIDYKFTTFSLLQRLNPANNTNFAVVYHISQHYNLTLIKATDSMKSSSVISAGLIALAIVISGFCLKAGIDNIAFRDREVTVRGLAEREVEANLVTWPITYSLAGNNLQTIYDQVSGNNEKIVKFLTSNGISADEISVNPPDTYDATSNRYRSDSFNYNYSINCTVTVTTTKVAKVRELLNRQSELLKEGIAFSNSYINYQFTGLNSIKPEMIAEATKNARAAADQFAADSESRVGKIKTASQGQFSIDDSDSSTPFIKKVRVVSTIVYYLED